MKERQNEVTANFPALSLANNPGRLASIRLVLLLIIDAKPSLHLNGLRDSGVRARGTGLRFFATQPRWESNSPLTYRDSSQRKRFDMGFQLLRHRALKVKLEDN